MSSSNGDIKTHLYIKCDGCGFIELFKPTITKGLPQQGYCATTQKNEILHISTRKEFLINNIWKTLESIYA
tara:strand:- start:12530 stop:12742 length:213 start_codon:yes stop_codon:yes gene_type:complete